MEDSLVKRKQKSIEQIREQAKRLVQEMDRRTLNFSVTPTQAVTRGSRIGRIADRYIRNIAQSKQFSNDYSRSGVESARKRAYSQNTYMGINNG